MRITVRSQRPPAGSGNTMDATMAPGQLLKARGNDWPLIASEASNYRLGGSREHFLGGYSSLQTPDEQNILCEAQNTPSCAYSTIQIGLSMRIITFSDSLIFWERDMSARCTLS